MDQAFSIQNKTLSENEVAIQNMKKELIQQHDQLRAEISVHLMNKDKK